MNQTEQTVVNAALSLSPKSRAQLADILWASLPEDQLDVPLDDEVRRAWADEAKRRLKDVDEGDVELLPGDEVMERLQAKMEK